jgi:hypothetical protein
VVVSFGVIEGGCGVVVHSWVNENVSDAPQLMLDVEEPCVNNQALEVRDDVVRQYVGRGLEVDIDEEFVHDALDGSAPNGRVTVVVPILGI